MTREHLNSIVQARLTEMETALQKLPDETAVDVVTLFEKWEPDRDYVAGQRLRFGEKLYRVEQDHHSQMDWLPPNVPALYTEIAKPGEIPVWRQPTGAQDAYKAGDKVHYPGENDPVYVSTVDNNVWAPDVYGWRLEG